ncbi:MAG: carbon starvation CstA family protein [Thermoguttaceae bacterium]
MSTLFIILVTFFGYIIAYKTYGRFLARKIFKLDENELVPSVEKRDNIDYVPTNRYVIFGHHFTTIAGTGPIVGPAIAVMWGWLPALIWVLLGSIFIGAVNDFTALIMSLRHKGQTLGDIAGSVISPTAKLLFLILLVFLLAIVIAVFGIVIAQTFEDYPISVLPTLISIPIAICLGLLTNKFGFSLKKVSFVAFVILGATIYLTEVFPFLSFKMPGFENISPILNPIIMWTIVLYAYCFFASVLPVWLLLQPRDYVNSLLLYGALGLIIVGMVIAALSGNADIIATAPAVRIAEAKEAGAPPILPFLFITVACGAVSGFHALVSSGTTSKQVASMKDAQFVGYGAMLLEGVLAVVVILSCTAGIGMGVPNVKSSAEATKTEAASLEKNIGELEFVPGTVKNSEKTQLVEPVQNNTDVNSNTNTKEEAGTITPTDGVPAIVTGKEAWNLRYNRKWSEMNLGEQVGIFIEGGANFMYAVGLPIRFGQAIVAILIACFAATTIDSTLRLMRYVLEELGSTLADFFNKLSPRLFRRSETAPQKLEDSASNRLTSQSRFFAQFKKVATMRNRYIATGIGLALATTLALSRPSATAPFGTGGLILWPLFGAGNQVIAGLTLIVGTVYLMRRKIRAIYLILPAAIMFCIPIWAMSLNIFDPKTGFIAKKQYLLACIGCCIILLACWLLVEAYRVVRKLIQ